jgi:hypothetical protein
MPNWVSLRAYAKHRGVRLSAVQKAIETKRVTAVTRREDGRITGIDQDLADQQWALNTDPAEAAKNGKFAGTPAPNTATSSTSELPLGTGAPSSAPPAKGSEDQNDYLAHRAKREEFQAKEAELSYLERVGALVSAADVRDQQFDIFRQHRDKLEQIPASVSERLAAETDPQRVEHMLRTAIRTTLNELSRALAIDAPAAAGPGERAPAAV